VGESADQRPLSLQPLAQINGVSPRDVQVMARELAGLLGVMLTHDQPVTAIGVLHATCIETWAALACVEEHLDAANSLLASIVRNVRERLATAPEAAEQIERLTRPLPEAAQ